jgi:protein-S-isoprenylcysteine O-methyltransferase Ste14
VRRRTAAITSLAFFALAPGVVVGFMPWYLTNGWTRNEVRDGWLLALLGSALFVAGAAVLVEAFVRYVIDGRGTPAPVAPTERLVVSGLNRYVRNPMYEAVIATILGQALVLAQPPLLVYTAVAFATMAAFTRWYEEPVLAQQHGAEYEAYRKQVPRWLPRVRH